MSHTYYIPSHNKFYGDEKDNMDVMDKLYETYLEHRDPDQESGRYDGVSIFNSRIRIVINCTGAGTGRTFDLT